MNFMGNITANGSRRQPQGGFYQERDQAQLPPVTYNRGWLDSHGGEGGSSSQVDLMMMDSSSPRPPGGNDADHDEELSAARGSGGGDVLAAMVVVEKEHMFDKVVTPSDVGKLNRLVIPKQHAERYFPLDSSTNEKGLLLNFEDRNGKPWRFRYSYWNSSQSYVMTKGWSRFVKEKKLDAGDIVSFQRGAGDLEKDRLFIDWRRRPDAPPPELLTPVSNLPFPHHFSFQHRSTMNIHPWNMNPLFLHPQPGPQPSQRSSGRSNLMLQPLSTHMSNSNYGYGGSSGGPYSYNGASMVNQCQGGPVIYFRSGAGAVAAPQEQVGMVQMQRDPPVVFESVPVVHGKAAAKRLRLFGVNMDCPISADDDLTVDDEPNECQILPSTVAVTSTTNPITGYNVANYPPPPQYISSSSSTNGSSPSSSSSSIPYLQLRPYNNYNGMSSTPLSTTVLSSSSDLLLHKSKASSMSLDLDI